MTYRKIRQSLEGRPTPRLCKAAKDLDRASISVGIALNAKSPHRTPYRTYVLLGDSEMVEGSRKRCRLPPITN
jgi:transketolase